MKFLNLFKTFINKPIVLNCYTDRPEIYNFSRPMKAAKATPAWWKVLPKTLDENSLRPFSSMKRCKGFNDLYTKGIVLPMWSDLRVQLGPIGSEFHRWQYADNASGAVEHPQMQRGEYLPSSHYQHLKLLCPWHCTCEEDISWLVFGATWNFNAPEEIIIPAGVVDYKYQTESNVNMFFVRGEQEKIIAIEHGQPLLHIVPISDRPVVCNYHLVSPQELKKHINTSLWFLNLNKNTRAASNGRCPFEEKR